MGANKAGLPTTMCSREMSTYARVRTNSERSLEHIIIVHDIRYDDGSNARSCYLLVTKYSVRALTYPLQAQHRILVY